MDDRGERGRDEGRCRCFSSYTRFIDPSRSFIRRQILRASFIRRRVKSPKADWEVSSYQGEDRYEDEYSNT